MNYLLIVVAMGPVGLYLLLIGLIQLMQRPVLVSGTVDLAALALAVFGLVLVGPMRLFFPLSAWAVFGPYVWLLLLALYVLVVILLLLVAKPRIVAYNIGYQELRLALADVAVELDPQARWAGDALALPELGVHLYLESSGLLRQVTLKAIGSRQNIQGWNRLRQTLVEALADVEVAPNWGAVALIVLGALTVAAAMAAFCEPVLLGRTFLELLFWE